MTKEKKRLQITVPSDCGPGDRLDIVYAQNRTIRESEALDIRITALENQRRLFRRQFTLVLTVWITMEFIAVIFLILTIALNVGATLSISSACGAVDPISGARITSLFLNFFFGLTNSSKYCKNSSETFCLDWTSKNWITFETLSGYPAEVSSLGEALIAKSMFNAQILTCLSLGFVVIASILHGLVLFTQFSTGYGVFLASSYFLLIAFALSIAALSNIVTASAFSPNNWTQYFRSGATLTNLLNNVKPSTTAAAEAPGETCYTSLSYQGGALLSASIALLFVLMIWTLFSGCLVGPIVFKVRSDVSASATSSSNEPREAALEESESKNSRSISI